MSTTTIPNPPTPVALKGSPAQIEWATKIRAAALADLDAKIEKYRTPEAIAAWAASEAAKYGLPVDLWEERIRYLLVDVALNLERHCRVTNAGWWIDNRSLVVDGGLYWMAVRESWKAIAADVIARQQVAKYESLLAARAVRREDIEKHLAEAKVERDEREAAQRKLSAAVKGFEIDRIEMNETEDIVIFGRDGRQMTAFKFDGYNIGVLKVYDEYLGHTLKIPEISAIEKKVSEAIRSQWGKAPRVDGVWTYKPLTADEERKLYRIR